MELATLKQVWPLFHYCFPEVHRSSLDKNVDVMRWYMLEDSAFVCVYPCNFGVIVQYMGVSPWHRGRCLSSRMIQELRLQFPELDLYGECAPDGLMHRILLERGWSKIPINYSCPAWDEEPLDSNLDLLVNPCGDSPVNPLGFLTSFYTTCFRNPDYALLERYKKELQGS